MDSGKTQLRISKAVKKRLNETAKSAGYPAELLADTLLSEALAQIDEKLMPVGVLQHVRIIRERLNRPVSDDFEAKIERYIARRDETVAARVNEAPRARRKA